MTRRTIYLYIARTMDEIDELLETLEQNEAVEKKFFEVEVSILSILNFKDFFENLLSEIKEKFLIPYVWVSFIEDNDDAKMILEFASSELLNQRLSLIDKNAFMTIVGSNTRPILVNKDLQPYYKMLPQSEGYLIRSMAIAPITLDGDIIGSLNFGDTFDSRYFPGMDTSLLERLAVKVSICLSNVMAHEKMKKRAERNSY
ncbi:MAG: GAF domain-containing protein [Deltaproteobacteria bacterium]|nr:GAF domain-containing protein [Deltaproteobacteria bacterium]